MEPKSRNSRRLLGWLGHGDDRAKLVDAARQAYDPDRVLALLADAPGNFPNLEDHRLWAHKEKQRAAQLEYARRHRRWDRVLAILDDVPPDYPNLASLRAEAVAAQRPETSPSSVPAQEDLTVGLPVEAPALAEPGRATRQLEPQPSNALASPAEASGAIEPALATQEVGANPSGPFDPAEVDLGLGQRAEVGELASAEEQATAVAPAAAAPPAGAAWRAPSAPAPELLGAATLMQANAAAATGVAEPPAALQLAATELSAGRWREAWAALAGLASTEVAALPESSRDRLGRLALDIAAAAETVRDWTAGQETLQHLLAWQIHEEEATDLLPQFAASQQADLLAAAVAAAPVVDEALEELWDALPRILRRFEREEIDEVIEFCQQHSALEELQLRAEEALESAPGNLTAFALAGGASAVRGHGAAALGYYAEAIEAIEKGARRQDWVEYFYLRARALDPSRAFAMIDREGGIFDTEEGIRYLYEQARTLDPEDQARQTALAGLLAVAGCRRASQPLLAARALIRDLATS